MVKSKSSARAGGESTSKKSLAKCFLTVSSAKKDTSRPTRGRVTRQQAAMSASSQSQNRESINAKTKVAEDVEMDSDDMTTNPEATDPDEKPLYTKKAGQQSLKRATRSTVPSMRGRVIPPSQSPSPSDSAISTVQDHFSEYETPGTSLAVTPAESLSKDESSALLKTTGRGNLISENCLSSKRKHDYVLEDALLAHALQEEEYQSKPPSRGTCKTRTKVAIEDSEDDELNLSDVDRGKPVGTDPPPSKRRKIGGGSPLQARAARQSATKFISQNITREIVETDPDESDSEYESHLLEYEYEDSGDSEDSDHDTSVPNAPAPPDTSSTTAPTTLPNRRRAVDRASRTRNSRHYGTTRVSPLA